MEATIVGTESKLGWKFTLEQVREALLDPELRSNETLRLDHEGSVKLSSFTMFPHADTLRELGIHCDGTPSTTSKWDERRTSPVTIQISHSYGATWLPSFQFTIHSNPPYRDEARLLTTFSRGESGAGEELSDVNTAYHRCNEEIHRRILKAAAPKETTSTLVGLAIGGIGASLRKAVIREE